MLHLTLRILLICNTFIDDSAYFISTDLCSWSYLVQRFLFQFVFWWKRSPFIRLEEIFQFVSQLWDQQKTTELRFVFYSCFWNLNCLVFLPWDDTLNTFSSENTSNLEITAMTFTNNPIRIEKKNNGKEWPSYM